MKKNLLLLGFLFLVKSINSQTPKADFDFVVNYYCGYAYVELANKSINYDSCFWDEYGYGNYVYINNPNPPIGNLDSDHDFKISLIAKGNGILDTITKTFNLRQTRSRFEYGISDSLQFAPLLINFINQSQQFNGDTLTYKWDFDDGDTSTLTNPVHVYSNPKTYYSKLTATTQSGCKLNSGADIIVKDTAQRNEFNFITGGCYELGYDTVPCGYDKHFIIINDTLKVYGFYGGNCCSIKTATLKNSGDTIYIRTFETGPECMCDCGFCFSINVPNIYKDSIIVSFDGVIAKAKLLTSITKIQGNFSFEIYPNPIYNEFILSCNKLNNKSSIEIQDLFGRVVYRLSRQLFDKMVIHCDNIKPGVFILKVNIDNNNYMTRKIIINNAR